MFYPFSLAVLSRDAREKVQERPLESRDLRLAHEWCETHLPRFPAYRRQLIEGQVTALLIGAAVPGIGHFVFGWPLQLLILSLMADCIAALLADKIRDHYAEPAFIAALRAALHGEQTLATAAALGLGGRPGSGRVREFTYGGYTGNLAIMLIPCLLVGAASFHTLLPKVGLLPLLGVVAVPFAARLLQAVADVRRRRPSADVDLHFLPQSLVPLSCASLALLFAFVLSILAMLLPIDRVAQEYWSGYAAAGTYLIICIVFERMWRRRLDDAQALITAFASESLAQHEQRLGLMNRW